METGSAVEASVRRGLVLKGHRRFAEAERQFKEALAIEPDNDLALFHLASCVGADDGRRAEALAIIGRAISVNPEDGDHHALKAMLLAEGDRPEEALESAKAAVRLAPEAAFAFLAKARAHVAGAQWAEAEAAARRALQLDPDNSSAGNILAHALRMSGQKAENAAHLRGMLARDAEDPWTHANAGWAALQAGRRREAEEHFREALRLDAGMDSAREGLLDCFRARSPLYRGYLAYCFWMQSFNKKMRWTIIIALYLGARMAKHLRGTALAPVGVAVGVLYFLMVIWGHVARGVGNFMLLFDPFARLALRPGEVWEACAVGGCITAGVLLLAAGLPLGQFPLMVAAAGLIVGAIPLAHTFTNASPIGSRLFGGIGAYSVLGGLGLGLCLGAGIKVDGTLALGLGGGMMLALLSTWAANLDAFRR